MVELLGAELELALDGPVAVCDVGWPRDLSDGVREFAELMSCSAFWGED